MTNGSNDREKLESAVQGGETTFRSQAAWWLSELGSGRLKSRQKNKRGQKIIIYYSGCVYECSCLPQRENRGSDTGLFRQREDERIGLHDGNSNERERRTTLHTKDHRQLLPDRGSSIRHCKGSQRQTIIPASVGSELHRPPGDRQEGPEYADLRSSGDSEHLDRRKKNCSASSTAC
jgi:hypothetical protein